MKKLLTLLLLSSCASHKYIKVYELIYINNTPHLIVPKCQNCEKEAMFSVFDGRTYVGCINDINAASIIDTSNNDTIPLAVATYYNYTRVK